MKKRVLMMFLLAFLFFITLTSGKYACSDGSEFMKDSEEIRELERKSVNSIGIAIFKADEFSALGGIKAEVIVDAERVLLSNDTSSEEIEISGAKHTVTLLNATNENAKIKIGSSSDDINEKEIDTLGGLRIILVKSDVTGENLMSAEVIVGKEDIILSTDSGLNKLVSINEKKYLIELISASDTDAMISVSKCRTGNLTEEKEIKETIAAENENLEINETANETLKDTNLQDNGTIENRDKPEIKKEEQGFFKRLINWVARLFKFR